MNAPSLIVRKLSADLETPVSVFLKTHGIAGTRFLLESVEGGAARGRYSVIGLQPDMAFIANEKTAEIQTLDGDKIVLKATISSDILGATRDFIKSTKMQIPEGIPAMAAGVYGYLGYDTIRHIEAIPAVKDDPLNLPEILLVRPSIIIIFDHVMEELLLCAPVYSMDENATQIANEKLNEIEKCLNNSVQKSAGHSPLPSREGAPNSLKMGAGEGILHISPSSVASRHLLPKGEGIIPVSNTPPEAFMGKVNAVKDYVAAGDIFQTVLSQRFELPFEHHPFSFYRALRKTNPAPYLFYFDFDTFQIAGSSPEILVRLSGETVTIRPIAGTRKRGETPAQDAANAADLLADPKELAEHLMLLDLGRNDVGKVAKLGSVKVTEQFFLEYYSHVMHIVSNVEGTLNPQFDALNAFFAGFPAGTVSGAPKVRAMEIINELEPVKRGVYGGGVGYFSANGSMDTCIALRTAVIKDQKIYIQAGAGIVADSVPASEQAECENKAKALIRATEIASQFEIGQSAYQNDGGHN